MFGLTRDFIQKDGISMILSDPAGMTGDKLNMVQARMLMNAEIPHHLRLMLKEIDLKVSLEYGVSRKKMLSHLLKSEKLSMISFFGLLLQVTQAIEEGRLYMLSAEQYALHVDYIFIEGSLQSGKVYLTYVPLLHPQHVTGSGEGFRSLVTVLMASVKELHGDGVQRLLQCCGEEDFAPSRMKLLLAELMTEGDVLKLSPVDEKVRDKPFTAVHSSSDVAGFAQQRTWVQQPQIRSEVQSQGLRNNKVPVIQEPPPSLWTGIHTASQTSQNDNTLGSDEDEDILKQPSSHRTYIVLGCLLGDALIWKFLYFAHPVTLWLTVCGVLTLVLGGLCWLVWTGKLSLGGKDDDEPEAEEILQGMALKSANWNSERQQLNRNQILPRWSLAVQQGDSIVPKMRETGHNASHSSPVIHADVQSDRQLKAATEATVLLTADKAGDKEANSAWNKRVTPYLERCEQGNVNVAERIELDRPSFIIGRSAEVAQYVEKSEGTSRVHTEILKSPSGYIIKDLDSRNGTLLQGEAMVPYKEYPLTDGAVFTIVKSSYTFRTA